MIVSDCIKQAAESLNIRRVKELAEWIKNPRYDPPESHVDDEFGVKYKTPPQSSVVHIHLTGGGHVTVTRRAAEMLLVMNVIHKFEPGFPANGRDKIWRELMREKLMQRHPNRPGKALLTKHGCNVLGHFISMLEHERNGRKA